jgi:hypothetical protein
MVTVQAMNGEIREGDLLWWNTQKMFMKVAKINRGGIARGTSGLVTPGEVVCEVKFSFQPSNDPDKIPTMMDFLRVIDPEHEKLVHQLAGG